MLNVVAEDLDDDSDTGGIVITMQKGEKRKLLNFLSWITCAIRNNKPNDHQLYALNLANEVEKTCNE